jgi:hypothetical protein
MSDGNGSAHGNGHGNGNGHTNGNGHGNSNGNGRFHWKRPGRPGFNPDSDLFGHPDYDLASSDWLEQLNDQQLLHLMRRLQGLPAGADRPVAPAWPLKARFNWPLPPVSDPEPPCVEPKNRLVRLRAAGLKEPHVDEKEPQVDERELVAGLLEVGQPSGIFGAPLSIKSTIVLDLAMSIASGTPFLGQFAVPKSGPVALFSEEFLSDLSANFRRIRQERKIPLAALENLTVCPRIPQLDDPLDVMAIQALIATEKQVCVIIDSAYLAFGKKSSHNAPALRRLLQPVQKMCASTGCAIVLAHPCTRSRPSSRPATLADVAWKPFADYASQWVLLARRPPSNLFGKAPHELWLSAGNRGGRQALWALDVDERGLLPPVDDDSTERLHRWKTTVSPANRAAPLRDGQQLAAEDRRNRRRAATRARQREHVLELLALYPEGRTANSIRDRLGLNGTRLREILTELVNEGRLTATQIERGKRTEILYRLVR